MTVSDNIGTQPGLFFEAPGIGATRIATGVSHYPIADTAADIELAVYSDFGDVESLWRAFEATADCTAFQMFAWHDAWQRHVGTINKILPAIVVGREEGRVLFIVPLAVERGFATRRLVWHAWQLCDYNAPLLAPGFAERVSEARFARLWLDMLRLLKSDRRFAHDLVMLHKMPGEVAGLQNPFVRLPVTPPPVAPMRWRSGTTGRPFIARSARHRHGGTRAPSSGTSAKLGRWRWRPPAARPT